MVRKGITAEKAAKKGGSGWFPFWPVWVTLLCWGGYLLLSAGKEGMGAVMRYQCHSMAITAVQETVLQALQEHPEQFEALYHVQKDSGGHITSIQANTAAINRVELIMARQLEQRLNSMKQRTHRVPLGALLNCAVLAEMGPRVPMRILRESYVKAEIASQLRSAGVNQTEMVVSIQYTVTMNAAIGGYSAPISTCHQVPVMQLVIIGQVPNYYVKN